MKPLTNFSPVLAMILLAAISMACSKNTTVEKTAVIRREETAIIRGDETMAIQQEVTATAPEEVTAITLGEEFSLALGETTSIPSEELTLRLLGVPVDDRCPTQVECEYTGHAIVEVEVVKANGDSAQLEFNTNPMPDINRQSIAKFGYVFELARLDPYPEHPDKPIKDEQYRAVIVVQDELN